MYRANKKPDGLTGWHLIVVGLETRKWATFIRMNRAPSLSRNTSWYISDWISQLPVTVGYHSSPDNRTAPASTGLQTFSMLVTYRHSPLNSGFLSDMKFPEWKSFTCLTRPSIPVQTSHFLQHLLASFFADLLGKFLDEDFLLSRVFLVRRSLTSTRYKVVVF